MKKIKNMFNKPKMSIFFYVMAVLSLCYTMYTLYSVFAEVFTAVGAGQLSWISDFERIFMVIMNSSSSYFFYTLAFVFFGYACNYLNPKPKKVEEVVTKKQTEETEQ